jgi:hypothetical protein
MYGDPTFPAQKHVRIPNAWFNDNPDGSYIIETSQLGDDTPTHGKGQFQTQGILVGGQDSDDDATVATVCGWLHDENEEDVDDYELALNIVHPLRFKVIVSSFTRNNNTVQTDGRRIKIFGI